MTNAFGRATEDGTVYAITANGEIAIGQYTIGTPEEGLAFYTKRYDELLSEADLTLQRLNSGRANESSAKEVAAKLQAQIDQPTCVGDFTVFAAKVTALLELATVKEAERAAAKTAAREQALERRTSIVVLAESLANSTSWKPTQERFAVLLDEWKSLARGDRDAEQELWKRFSQARQTFDRARRTHFAELSKTGAAAKAVKSEILAEAVALASSTEWGPTTIKFRELMDRWKAAPRGAKKDDDALWTKFRAAQQAFFEAKEAANAVRDEELKGNLDKKLELLIEAEAILPVTDIKKAKKQLRDISERWSKAGHVPRADMARVEGRLHKVEQAITEAEQEEWRRNDPSRKAFAATTASRFQEAVDRIEADIANATKKGDTKKVADLQAQLANAKALVEAASKHA